MVRKLKWVLIAVLVLAAAPIWAQGTAATGVAWSSMPSAEQKLLTRFQNQWDTLPPVRQQSLERGAQRWLAMTPEQRDGAKQRFHRWKQLTPGEREVVRERWPGVSCFQR